MNTQTTETLRGLRPVLADRARPYEPGPHKPSRKFLKHQAEREQETEIERAARFERGKRHAEVMHFLLIHLFNLKNPRFISDAYRDVAASDGKVHSVKGWFATDPDTGAEIHFAPNITADITAARMVSDLMLEWGYSFRLERASPDAPYVATFFLPSPSSPIYFEEADALAISAEEEGEAFAVCMAAKLTIEDYLKKEAADRGE